MRDLSSSTLICTLRELFRYLVKRFLIDQGDYGEDYYLVMPLMGVTVIEAISQGEY